VPAAAKVDHAGNNWSRDIRRSSRQMAAHNLRKKEKQTMQSICDGCRTRAFYSPQNSA